MSLQNIEVMLHHLFGLIIKARPIEQIETLSTGRFFLLFNLNKT